jgi:hypothetical protein
MMETEMALSEADKEAGYRLVPQPNDREVTILRRIAAGYLLFTQSVKDGEAGRYTYDDGKPIMVEEMRRGTRSTIPMDDKHFNRLTAHGWLLPIEGETLIEGCTAQRWRARTTSDGVLPRAVKVA